MTSTFVSEIFPTIQGEGVYTGERQIFVRLAGCPLRCNYCDTPDSLVANGHQRMSPEEVVEKVAILNKQTGINSVSLTGGEPLAHGPFVSEMLSLLKDHKFRIYLETAGLHFEVLKTIIQWCEVVAMDIKLPSATGRAYWKEHEKFLEVGGDKIFVKIVITGTSTKEEFTRALRLLSSRSPVPILILQPVTPFGSKVVAPSAEQLAEFYALAKNQLSDVRVMPQQHKIWGVR